MVATLSQVIPAEAVLVHVFDINTRHFVVASAKSPTAERVLSCRTPDQDPFFADVMRHEAAFVLSDTASDPRFVGGRWELAGVEPRSVLCGPVRQGGRYLGLVEIANPEGDTPFQPGEVYALDYVLEQFADFLASRPLAFSPDRID
jgi:GAF domain-containing protein